MPARRPLRTRFGRDIVTEFLPPRRPSRDVVILCTGMPNIPKHHAYLEKFSQAGYWAFHPHYRGTWESDGQFLRRSPHEDIRDVMDGLSRGWETFTLDRAQKFRLNPRRIILIAGSFGGPAALLNSRDPRVKKVVALSPVVDWRVMGKREPLGKLKLYVRAAFGQGYRFADSDWAKLQKGNFYNPTTNQEAIDAKKVLLIHAKDDDTVPAWTVRAFAKETSSRLVMLSQGGHFSTHGLLDPKLWLKIRRFIRS
jgi:pimeloyl-ACP methyl ester carboxylesterase